MHATDFPEYSHSISDLLNEVVQAGHATLVNLQIDQRSAVRGLITGRLRFEDASELHFGEFIDLTQADPRMMYAYHFQDPAGNLVFRYDNALHRPPLPQVNHKHVPGEIHVAQSPTMVAVLDKILTEHMRHA